MNNTKIIGVAVTAIVVLLAGYWWLQWRNASDRAAQSSMLLHQPASDTSSPAKPQKVEEPKPSSLAIEMTAEGRFTVQISAWRSSMNAKREVERFQRAGYGAYVQRADIPSKGGVWYRVRVGQFNTRAEAERQARELEAQLDSGFWITQKN